MTRKKNECVKKNMISSSAVSILMLEKCTDIAYKRLTKVYTVVV